MNLETYLSEYVHRILVKYSETHQSTTRKFVSNDLVYQWKEIGDVLGVTTDDFDILDQSDAWYTEKSKLGWEVIHEAGLAISAASDGERKALYQLCCWGWGDVTDYAFLCQHEGEDGPLLAVLVLTAALERALGNIVFTQLLVGCPRGFNLRNVAWHGFVSVGELHPYLVSGLVVLVASFGKKLLDYQVDTKCPQFSSYESFQAGLVDVFPNIVCRCDEIEDMIKESPFIPERVKVLWRKALDLLQIKRYGYTLVLLMPQLEHCLRLIYCKVNDCPSRLLTAESTAFYTTLDEILAPSQKPVVDSGLLMLLLDMTSSLSGPRLRDRLSHGEIHLRSVPGWLVNLVLAVALATAHSHCANSRNSDQHCTIPLCYDLREVTSHYNSRFHIIASLRRQLASLVDRWPGWHNCSPPVDVDIQPVSCQAIHSLDQLMFSDGGNISEKLCGLKDCMVESQLSTLYRPKTELELAAALGSVASCVTQTAEQVCHAATSRHQLWCDRQLRSRGRATALRMWTVLPDVWTVLLCTVKLLILSFRQIPYLATLGKTVFRFVKMLQKVVQNTVTLCSSEKNRWMEAHQILSDMASECLQFVNNVELVK